MPSYSPPFTLTNKTLTLVAQISEAVGRLTAEFEQEKRLRLRKVNRMRTVQGSLAIEGNTLSEEQITAILDGKRVIAPPREVQEAHNAIDESTAQKPELKQKQKQELKPELPGKNVGLNVGISGGLKLSSLDEDILAHIKADRFITNAQLADKTSKAVRSIERRINVLKENNIIERIGSKKKQAIGS
ncbi:winged helix-turn-helix domain-containing protein [Colwellia psychrerythraea]|uniref:Uncharacterized protein n=1 Tax=Colwellia psychrerythraea TaxID=28229 RepID=A0A099KEC1_COLPS|nr:winged helix-turn-helix domain-containing protein [Colwellia psychrerythraea]KGJ88387.1 hypothetical protein ND2E_4223 [Colwellia psychrerythraea]